VKILNDLVIIISAAGADLVKPKDTLASAFVAPFYPPSLIASSQRKEWNLRSLVFIQNLFGLPQFA